MTQPFSVRIFLVDGDPAGIKTLEKANWSGVSLVFPQSLFAEARKRPELLFRQGSLLDAVGQHPHQAHAA